jgi:hypothetical protein
MAVRVTKSLEQPKAPQLLGPVTVTMAVQDGYPGDIGIGQLNVRNGLVGEFQVMVAAPTGDAMYV